MPELASDYIPIEQASTPRVRFEIPLPQFLPEGLIRVNIPNVHHLCRIGGISHLRVGGTTKGEITKYVPSIIGMDAQGNALAGRSTLKTSSDPIESLDMDDSPTSGPSFSRPHSATWVNGAINLNMNEISETIRGENRWRRGVYSTEAWAHHLNKSLNEGIAEIGIRHLLMGFTRDSLIGTLMSYMFMLVPIGQDLTVETLAKNLTIGSLVFNGIDYLRYRKIDDGYRFSVFYGPQLDRALALKILSKTTPLVRDFSETH